MWQDTSGASRVGERKQGRGKDEINHGSNHLSIQKKKGGQVMTTIGLDLALTTGYAIGVDGKVFESGVIDWRTFRKGGHNGYVFLALWGWLRAHLPNDDSLQLVFEVAHHRGGPATRLGIGWQTTVLHFAARYNLPDPLGVPTMTLKKFATGSGKAGKNNMIAYARNIIGRVPVDDNEADAVAVCMWGMDKKEK